MAALRSGMGGGPTTRRSRRHATADALGALWPDLTNVLAVELRQAGLGRDLTNEVMQDLAVEALAERAPTDFDGLVAWARPVAGSLTANLLDRPAMLDLDLLIEQPAADDVPHDASRRLALDAVLRRLAEMPEADREAVLAGLDYGTQPTLAEARHIAVRRFRARQVLARIAQSFGLVAAWRLTRRTFPRLAAPTATMATAAAVAFVLAPTVERLRLPEARGVPLPEAKPAVVVVLRVSHDERGSVTVARPPRPPLRAATKAPPQHRSVPAASATTSGTVIDGPAGTRLAHRQEAQHPDDPLACVYGTLIRRLCAPQLDRLAASEPTRLKNLETSV